MNAFTTFLQADWAERAGWALLHSLWQIAAVAAVYAIAALLLRNRSADSRYILGCVAILAMLGLPMGTYVLLSHNMPLEIAQPSNTPAVAARPTESPAPPSDLTEPAIASADPLPPVAHSDPVPAKAAPAETTTTKTVTSAAEEVSAEPATTDLFSGLRRYLPWATAAWLMGVLLLSLRPLWGWFHVRRLRCRGLSPLSDTLRHAGQRVKRRLGVNRAVRFVQSALVEVPTVIGCLRPMVLLPASAITGLSTAEIESILAHELAHVRRLDWLANLAQTVIEALLFYHPGMWWVSNQLRKERENCCDDMAVAVGGNRAVYVQALARLEEQRSATSAVALAATGGDLLTRVRRLLGKPTNECGYRHATAWLAGLITIGFVAAALAMNQAAEPASEEDHAEEPREAAAEMDSIDLQGTVLDTKTGKPIAGATIEGDDFSEWASLFVEATRRERVLTDSRGRYVLRAAKGGPDYRLGVHAAGYAPQWLDLELVAGTEPHVHDFKLTPGQRAYGVVTDEQKRPLAGVTVAARTAVTGGFSSFSMPTPATAMPGPPRRTTTDAAGRFEIVDLPGGQVQLSFSAKHRRVNDGNYAVGEPLKIVLSGSGKPGVLQVRAIDAQSSKPISAFHITRRHDPAWHAAAKADGRFRLPGERTRDRAYLVYVYAEGYAPAGKAVPAVAEDSDEYFTVRLTPAPAFAGQLVDAASGKPIAKAKIMYGVRDVTYFFWNEYGKYIDGYHGLAWVQRATTGDDGTFIFAEGGEAPNGALFILADGYQRTILHAADRVAADASGNVVVRLQPQATMSGVLTQAGRPLPSVEVRLWKPQSRPQPEQSFKPIRTDAQGRFRFENLAPGTYTVSTDCPTLGLGRRVVVDRGADATVALGADLGSHSFRGKAVPGARITLRPQFDWDYRSFVTTADASGNYRFEGLRAGEYSVALHRSYPATGAIDNRSLPPITIGGDEQRDPTPVTDRIAEQPKFAIYRVTGFRRPGNGPGTTKTYYFRDSGNPARFDPMRPERYPLDDLVLDGTPIISDSDLVAYEWRRHFIRLTPEAHNRLTKAVKPGGWGVPFVVQVEGTPVYLGAFWTSISSYTADMPTISLDRFGHALPENDPHHLPANAIRIENSQVLKEGEFPTDPRQDQRVYRALGKTGKLLDLRSHEPPWGDPAEGVQSRLRSGVFRGAQWLKFDLRNDSRDLSVQLALRGVPPEILVDNVPYRWSGRIAGALPVCKPGQHVAGAALKLDKNWTAIKTVSGPETLELKPGTHTVQAIVYAAKDTDHGGRKVRVLSNPLKIDVPARQAESDRESGRLAIDLICTAPELRQVPSTWIAYELLSEDALRRRVTEITEATPEVNVLVRSGRQVEHKHVAKLLDLLKTVGAKNVSLTVFPLDAVFALAPGPDRHGVIRGKVIGPDNRGEPVKYTVTLEHEKWRNRLGELPNLVVSVGEAFEFRNVPPGKCELRAQPIVPVSVIPPDRKTRPADAAAEVEVTLEAKQVVEVELSFGRSQASSVWGEAVEGVQFRLRCDRPRWHVDETIIFKIDVRNTGKRHLRFSPYAYPVKIDVDGRLFSLTGTRGTARSYELKPGQEQTNIDFRVSRRREFKERPFQLEPGKHTVKITLGVGPAEGEKGDVLQVTSNPVEITIERALPGPRLSVDKAIEEEAPFAAVCEAVGKFVPTTTLVAPGGATWVLQEFKVVEVLFGKAEPVDRIEIGYRLTGRPIAIHERVIWIGHTRHMSTHGSLFGLKALPDTPENRRAVKAAAGSKAAGGKVIERKWSDATIDFTLRVTEGTAQTPFVAEIVITNRTDQTQSVPTPHLMPLCGDTNKNNIRVFDKEKNLLKMRGIHGDGSGRHSTELPAKSSKTWRFELEKWFADMADPGTYQVEPWYFSDDTRWSSWVGRVKMQPLTVVRKEPLDPPWGKPVDGVSVRLTKAIAHRQPPDQSLARLLLRYDARNSGSRILHLPKNGLRHQVEVDGQWYEWADPRLTAEESAEAVDSLGTSALLDFEPGRCHRDGLVNVAGNWRAIPRGKEKEYAARQYSDWNPMNVKDDYGKELVLTPGKHRVRVAVTCPSARASFRGIVRAASEIVEVEVVAAPGTTVAPPEDADTAPASDSDDEMNPTEKESAARAKLSTGKAGRSAPAARPADAEARGRFLEIERIARLSAQEQAAQMPHLYRDLAHPIVGGLMGMSSYRQNILDPKSSGFPEGDADETWAKQLADAAGEKSPEEMADAIKSGNWLKLAARARALWVFGRHAEAIDKLLQSDLDSGDKSSVGRAARTINALKRTSLSGKLLEMYLADDEISKEVRHALLFMRDPGIVQPLLREVEKDPRLLIRCAGLFQGPLQGEPANPMLLKLVSSEDKEISYHAAYALYECKDAKLAPLAAKFAKDPAPRFRLTATHWAASLPGDAFNSIRTELLPLLADTDEKVRFDALRCFAQQKDLAAGPVLLDLLGREKPAEKPRAYEVTVMQALAALTGKQFGYFMHEWGPNRPSNRKAIEQLEAWLRERAMNATWGKPLDGLRCRWIPSTKPVPVGTKPVISMEVENASDKPILWNCASEITLGLSKSAPPSGHTMPKFSVRLGQRARLATPDYYRLEPTGRVVLTAECPWEMDKVGPAKIYGVVFRVHPITDIISLAEKIEVRCPPLILSVVGVATANPWGPKGTGGLQIRLVIPKSTGESAAALTDQRYFKAPPGKMTPQVRLEVRNAGEKTIKLAEQNMTGGRMNLLDEWLLGLSLEMRDADGDAVRRLTRTDDQDDYWSAIGNSGLNSAREIKPGETVAFGLRLGKLSDERGRPLSSLHGAGQLRPVLHVRENKFGVWHGTARGEFVPVVIQDKRDAAWSKPVEGVQARLRVFRHGAYSPDTVLKLLADVRNQGQRDLTVARAQQLCELEIDGRRYRWAGDIHVKSSWFPPGRQYEGIWIHLSDQWKCDGEPLVLKPGKHSVRVWLVANPTEKDAGEPVRFASNFVEIIPDDNLAVESLKKLGWRPLEKTNLIWDNRGRVSSIDIFAPTRDVHVTDTWLVPLKGMTELSMLILTGPQITDAGLMHLKGLTNLGHLVLGGTQITDDGLAHLSGMTKLHRLELTGTKVTDAGLVHLKGLTNLKSLFLDSTRVTKEGAEKLKQSLPNVKVFLGEATFSGSERR